ncbi:ABC transporter permease subunit [Paralimibaculum aggregatum]|uniref:ABC transporter permease subunit n=1 Tax=Paralimibaculum aggregatum TaxID=3036245 RepID=A0ABQ6LI93_9RHOB|nr:ABC transporter permease subunit [Limibaculum sp. NKW23]GMG82999.1 ABC transporter permease subunit [Limibaculum sp. NKW23]
MTAAPDTAPARPGGLPLPARPIAFALFCLALTLIVTAAALPAAAMRPPDWMVLPMADWINVTFAFVHEDLGLTVLTRAFADLVAGLLDITDNLLAGGRGGLGLPQIPWAAMAISGFMLGYGLKDWKLGALAGGTFTWLAVFGQWQWGMETLALIAVAAPLSVVLGFLLGWAAWRRPWVEAMLMPLLNIAQSLPHFAYLIPVVVFFGVGDHAGAIATVIFATPPMIRLTVLGLRRVAPEVVESGKMSGATRWQLMRYVRVPTARAEMLVGVNQVIMQCLAMVVIASFIGAPGLGYKLLQYLQGLKIGKAVEIGISVVLIAVMLDRLSRAWAELQPVHHERGTPWWKRNRLLLVWLGLMAAVAAASGLHDWVAEIPRRKAASTAFLWDPIVDWLAVEAYPYTNALRGWLLIHILIPLRDAYLAAPWTAVLALVAGIGWNVGGARSAAVCAGFVLFVAVSGWWDRAMITAYMVSVAVALAVAIGLPLGIWMARSERSARRMLLICDTFQTFPSFIYLIPVIMLFGVNDVAAIGAVVIYGAVPVIRYTIEGLLGVPPALKEAVDMSGGTRRQRLWSLELPMALPHMMVGLNQTVMFSLFMVIIAAFIGTQDLGQEMMRALSSNDVGKGLVLGLCVAFIGLMVDHLANTWAAKRRRALGLG